MRKKLAARDLTQEKATQGCIETLFDEIIANDILQSAGVGTDNMTAIVVEFL